jgi:hypothetical protein
MSNNGRNMKPIMVAVLASGAIGCNSGHWVDTPMLSGYICDPKGTIAAEVQASQHIGVKAMEETPEQAQQQMEQMFKLQAQGTCGQGGGAFTGDTRCENGAGQVKCK